MGPESPQSQPSHQSIIAFFGEKTVHRGEVLAWEAKRANKTLRKLGASTPHSGASAAARRAAVTNAKLSLGHEEMERRLVREINLSDKVTAFLATTSGKRRRLSQVELLAPTGSASHLPEWYMGRAEAEDEEAMLLACPDHHIFRTVFEERSEGQEVWETTGGSPFASRFFFTLDDTEGLVTAADPMFPVQLVGVARLANGVIIGGIRHQFRDEGDGVRARLTVEMPWMMGPYGPAAHRWHLACEFSNWFEAAAAASH